MSKQFYGIKYPISEESDSLTFFDLNESKFESAKSMLLHIILTPKGQRLRHPNFGTNLIKFIFEQNDSQTWDSIKEDIRKQVGLYLSEVHFDDIQIHIFFQIYLQHNIVFLLS
jgi:phage baseplate assembly protein W